MWERSGPRLLPCRLSQLLSSGVPALSGREFTVATSIYRRQGPLATLMEVATGEGQPREPAAKKPEKGEGGNIEDELISLSLDQRYNSPCHSKRCVPR